MSIAIAIRFLAGKFHATPWNHQVNEGIVEWPPSPWRVLRALVAAAYQSRNPPSREALCNLVTKLSQSLPCYVLPPCQAAHTRHFMPVWKEGQATTTKVFDTFLALGDGALSESAQVIVSWLDVQLVQNEIELLQQLCRQINYFGRAESWAEMTVLPAVPDNYNAIPTQQAKQNGAVQTQALAPLTLEGLEGFQAALATLPKPKKGKTKWQAPTTILQALELDVAELHAQGWNGIPGTRWVSYELEKPISSSSSIQKPKFPPLKSPTFARYAVTSNVLPSLTEALSVGERFRIGLMSRSDGDVVFSGRDASGEPIRNNHQHAWYLPEDIDGDGRIDHVVVYAAGEFSLEKAIPALQKLSKVWGREGFDLQTILIALGRVEDYRADLISGEVEGRSLVVGSGRIWRSMTPVVLPRFPKKKINPETGLQVDGPEHQVRQLLKQLGKDEPLTVKLLEEGKQVGKYPWHAFKRQRNEGKGSRGPRQGYGFELVFEQSQFGPIALGYAAHFGLGVFVPVG